jgi:DHA1 family tetracycline resistance protein-like MFS transporter
MLSKSVRDNVMGIVGWLREEFSFVQGNYLILVVSWILMDFASEMPSLYYGPWVMYDLKASASVLGFIGFASIIALAAVQFPGGFLADKYGRKWLISTLTFGVAFSFLFYAFAPSWEWVLVGGVISNVCLLYQPALMAMISDSTTPEKRGMAFSLTTLIGNVATTPAPIVVGIIVAVFTRGTGMRIAYGVVVALYLCAAVLRTKLKETIRTEEKIRARDLLSSYPQAIKESVAVWKTLPRSVFFLFVSSLVVNFAVSLGQLFFAVYAVEGDRSVLGISQIDWAFVSTVLFISMIIFAVPIGKMIDKVGRKVPLLLSHVAFVPGILLFVYGDLTRLFVAMPLVGLGQLLFFSSFFSLQTDMVPRENRAKVIGFSQFFSYISMAIGMLVGGIIYSVAPQLPFLLMLMAIIPSLFIVLFLVHEPEKRHAG